MSGKRPDELEELLEGWCRGDAGQGPGLGQKSRSMINLAILIALNNVPEIKLHVRAALASGVSVDEIKHVLGHATNCCGIPADLEAIKAARETLEQCDEADDDADPYGANSPTVRSHIE